jgi:hypothetical protein
MTRNDWVCYLCQGTASHKRRVRINSITTECIYLCADDLPNLKQAVLALRGLLS